MSFLLLSPSNRTPHLNPAITISVSILRKIKLTSAVFILLSQFIGALIGAGFIFIQIDPVTLALISEKSKLGIPYAGGHTENSALWAELIGTFFITYMFMASFLDSNKNKLKNIAPILVGLIVYVCKITLGELSGGGFNPARSIGPAIVGGRIESNEIILLFAPFVGSIMASVVFNSIFVDD